MRAGRAGLMRVGCAGLLALMVLTGHTAADPQAVTATVADGVASTRPARAELGPPSPARRDDDARVRTFAATLGGGLSAMSWHARSEARWQWPLPGQPRIARHFELPDERWLPGHRGLDLVGHTYSPVLAVADGTVTYSGSIAGVGIVSVTHPDGIRSTYQPVTDRVGQGEVVRAGEELGTLGVWGSHCALRACLHLGAVRGNDDYLDPLLFLQGWELTLLPHG